MRLFRSHTSVLKTRKARLCNHVALGSIVGRTRLVNPCTLTWIQFYHYLHRCLKDSIMFTLFIYVLWQGGKRCAAFRSSDCVKDWRPDPECFLGHSGTLSNHANTQSQWRWFPPTNAPISRSKPSLHPDHCHQNSRLIRLCKPPVGRNLLKWDLRKGGLLVPVDPSYQFGKNVQSWKPKL